MATIRWMENDKLKAMNTLQYKLYGKSQAYRKYTKGNTSEYIVPENIDLLCLQDFTLDQYSAIQCKNINTVVILKNCLIGNRLTLKRGSIVIENPQISTTELLSRSMYLYENPSVELVLNDRDFPGIHTMDYYLRGKGTLKITGNAVKSAIFFTGKPQLVELENVQGLTLNDLTVGTLKITNSKVEHSGNIRYTKQYIKESEILGRFNSQLIKEPKTENSNLDQARMNLLQFLKTLEESTNHQEIVEDAKKQIAYHTNLITEHQAEIDRINEGLDYLTRQKVKNIVPSGRNRN